MMVGYMLELYKGISYIQNSARQRSYELFLLNWLILGQLPLIMLMIYLFFSLFKSSIQMYMFFVAIVFVCMYSYILFMCVCVRECNGCEYICNSVYISNVDVCTHIRACMHNFFPRSSILTYIFPSRLGL